MDKNSAFGELVEKGQQSASNTAQAVVSDVGDSIVTQLGFKNESGSNNTQNTQQTQNQAPVVSPGETAPNPNEALGDNELTKEMVEDFYSPSVGLAQNISSEEQERLDTQQRLVALRKELHNEVYYDPLVNPKKQEEERSAQRVERQEKEEMQDLEQKNADKPPPIAVQRAQTSTEINRGVSG